MKNKISFLYIPLGLLAICLFALLPLFHFGFFTIHDDEQIARLQQMYVILSQGQIPPRWVPDLGFGFGYPLFIFYPPLVYYVGALFHLIGFSFINATKLVIGLGFILSAATMFVWVKKHYGNLAALFAAILYTYAPYHSVDIYVRGALSEFFSWIWIPAIFWSMDMLFEKFEKKYIMLFAVFYALLMLSHTLVMLQFAPIFGIYAIFLFFGKRKEIRKKLISLSIALLLGLGLSAYFWIPSLVEKGYTMVDSILTTQLANYAIHFVCPIQLWSGPWGYGGSVAGCVDGLSFQLGKIQAIVAGLGILLSLFFVIKKKRYVPSAVAFIFLFSLFMTLPYSKFIWDSVKPFWYIQFPWRYLLFTSVASAFLGGFILYVVQKKFGFYGAVGLAILLSALAVFQVRNYFQPQTYLPVSDSYYTSKEAIQWHVSGLSYEYVPKEVATRLSPLNTTELAITRAELPKASFSIVSGKMQVKEEENISQLKKYAVNVYNTKTSQAVLQINTYNFPGWKVYANGKLITQRLKNRLDVIRFQLPPGAYRITVEFTDTPIRLFAVVISSISVFLLLGLLVWRKTYKI